MDKSMSLLWEVSFAEFLIVTVILAGGAAYLTGCALARVWQSNSRLTAYVLLLAAATRFIHSALFEGTLLSLHYYAVDFAVLLVLALLGKRRTRTRQMTTQYGFVTADRRADPQSQNTNMSEV